MLDQAPPAIVSEVESALAEICRRTTDASPIVGALPKSSTRKKVGLLNVLAAVGGPQAVTLIQGELDSADGELRMAALRLLAEWPDPAPLNALGKVALTSSDERVKALALRGVARLAPQAQDRDIGEILGVIGRAIPNAGLNEQRALIAALGEIPTPASLKIVVANLAREGLAAEARQTACKILDRLDPAHRADAQLALNQLKVATSNAAESARLEWLTLKFSNLQNLSTTASATNLDGLTPDGQGGPPSAAIDGDEKTYWDEVDNQKLYLLRVDLKRASKIATIRIVGWQQHNYAPRDFEIFGDGKLLKRITGAEYQGNSLRLDLPAPVCRSLELRITSWYGASPAIRELEIYGTPQ